MTLPSNHPPSRGSRAASAVAGLVCASLMLVGSGANAQAPAGAPPAARPAAEQGARWSELKPAQQDALRPLEREWNALSAPSKQKWLLMSARFPKLTPPERARVQERMSAWTRLTPRERVEARINYQEAKQLPMQDRQARWKAYEALTPEQKQRLAARAAPAAATAAAPGEAARRTAATDKPRPQLKSNIVPNPTFAAPPTAVAPTVVRARPGATTTLITKRPSPPGHQQTGMPKIAATPEFVNKSTLLPQRGPQGAATRSAIAPETEGPSRQ